MRTNIVLDDALMREAFEVSQCRTKKDLLHEALRELVENRRRRSLADLAGKVSLAPGYDHKAQRR